MSLKLPFFVGKIGKTNIGWAIVTFVGLYSFALARNQIEKQRSDALKSKLRMLNSNEGDYEMTTDRRFN